MLLLVALVSPLMVLLTLVILAIDLILGWLAIGAFLRSFQIFNRTILVERDGIHFFRGRRKELSIPWDSVDDFSFSGSRLAIKVGDDYYYVSRELNDFEEFERLITDQLSMDPDQRGANLPSLDMPESFGGRAVGIRSYTPEPQDTGFGAQFSPEPDTYGWDEEPEILGTAEGNNYQGYYDKAKAAAEQYTPPPAKPPAGQESEDTYQYDYDEDDDLF